MKNTVLLVLVLIFMMVSACSRNTKVEKLEIGMSENQVESILGDPREQSGGFGLNGVCKTYRILDDGEKKNYFAVLVGNPRSLREYGEGRCKDMM